MKDFPFERNQGRNFNMPSIMLSLKDRTLKENGKKNNHPVCNYHTQQYNENLSLTSMPKDPAQDMPDQQ